MANIVVAYHSADRGLARALHSMLTPLGHDVWLGEDRILPGDSFVAATGAALAAADYVIAFVSHYALADDWVASAIEAALARQLADRLTRLFVVRASAVELADEMPLISNYMTSDAFPEERRTEGLQRVCDAITAREGGRGALLAGADTHAERQFGERGASLPLGSTGLSLGRLPSTRSELFGRAAELEVLSSARQDPHVTTVVIVAWGGVGKTALVNRWLSDHLSACSGSNVERILAWSFHSQGAGDGGSGSSDLFIEEALRSLGDPVPVQGSPWQRGERLAALVRRERTLVVLDGIEPLQDPRTGAVRDPALKALLLGLAARMDGLCVITTRPPFSELERFEGQNVRRLDLTALSREAGMALLRERGVRGEEAELSAAVGQYRGHALSLSILGNYLRDAFEGSIRHRFDIDLVEEDFEGGRQAWKVVSAYDVWFGSNPERWLLRLLGLFDRPAEYSSIAALCAPPAIAGVTDALVGLTARQRMRAVVALVRTGLATANAGDGSIDAHPLVREYFGRILAAETAAGFKEAHGRLFELRSKDDGSVLSSAQGLGRLLQSVTHACHAGRHQEAFETVYWPKIRRGDLHYSVHGLGAIGSDLAALAGFFEERWTRPVTGLNAMARSRVLNAAGHALAALGRIADALPALEGGLEIDREQKDWHHASIAAGHLVIRQIYAGRLRAAERTANRGLVFARKSKSLAQERSQLARKAYVAQLRGQLRVALEWFAEADRLLARMPSSESSRRGIADAHYAQALGDAGMFEAAYELAVQSYAESQGGEEHLGNLALYRLVEAQALARLGRAGDAAVCLAETRDLLHRAGRSDYEVFAQLAEAFVLSRSDAAGAEALFGNALTLAVQLGFRLAECDSLLGLARLGVRRGHLAEAARAWTRAAAIVGETGYDLREADVLSVECSILARRGHRSRAREVLERARSVANAAGYGSILEELGGLEEDAGC
jgi:hypothetical protein